MKSERPPKWADRFLEWYCRPELLEEIQGEVYELYFRDLASSKRKANWNFTWNTIRFCRWKNIRKKRNSYLTQNSLDMLKNYLKIGLRSLQRYKAFSLINITGLAIGLTSFLLIGSFVKDELSYDKYASNYKNIYRVGLRLAQNGGIDDYPNVDMAVAAGMKSTFPEILESTRLTGVIADYVRHQDANVREESLVYADSNFLKIFSIPLIEGNIVKALVEPSSIVISKEFAKKYFGDKSPLGELLSFRRNGLLKVTGVFDKIPEHSHFHFDAFISMTTNAFTKGRQTWSNVGFYSYVVLNNHVDPRMLEEKFPQLVEKFVISEVQADMGVSYADATKTVESWRFYLMPIKDIHLHSHTKYEMEANGDIGNVYTFGTLAIFILLLACINFMNLSTASSARRSLEIGVRKVMGSFQGQLMTQFLIESVILSLVALLFALVLTFLLLPFFNQLTGKHISVSDFTSPGVLTSIIALGLVVGVLAGSYPAIFLSSFQPLRVLKSSSRGGTKKGSLRSALVVFQFAISTALIIATIVVYQQVHFMQNIELGYEKDQILVIENAGVLRVNEIPFKQKIKLDHRVMSATNSSVPVGSAGSFGGTEVFAKGGTGANLHISIFSVDYDYLSMLGMKLVAGRNFSREFPNDSLAQNVIINETAMHDLGWNENNAVGSVIIRSGQLNHQVVGVVKDFHYTSTKDKIAPLMMLYRGYSPQMLVKVKATEMQPFIRDLESLWNKFNPEVPLIYNFLDDRFAHLYKAEQTVEQLFIVFMAIAILIASLGLFGLSTYSAEQRIKEIGIRKVLGSSVSQIVFLQSREFLMLVLLAILIAAPLSWWVMHQWLQNFGYRIQINIGIIAWAAIAAIVIALITVSFQAIKAATANPVRSLKAE